MSRRMQFSLASRLFLGVLAVVYVVYLVGLGNYVYTNVIAPTPSIVEHEVETSANTALMHWSPDAMLHATDADQQYDTAVNLTQSNATVDGGKAVKHKGQGPRGSESGYPLSTVGKIFFSNASGQNMVCSGAAIVSSNKSTVDTAGHCLYWNGGWVKNLIFCPLYDNGSTPYGCWAARELEVPADWIGARPNDLHHDFGMAIVSANDQGKLIDVVGGAGYAYNQPYTQPYYAYGYPAAYPFDGQTRKSCESTTGKLWQHAGGSVISIPCNMTGGSSGGPWYIKSGNDYYISGHNDFISSIQPGHMFSPYYDDTWYALYSKAERA